MHQVTALVSADEGLAFRILALNTKKAHNLKDRSLEVIRMARSLAKLKPRAKEREFEDQFEAAELLTLEAAWKLDQGTMTDSDAAMAKLHATETLAMVTDEAIQIHGGMGLMDELPLERFWRDARVERIWEGTSEIQRHIISRALLRPLES